MARPSHLRAAHVAFLGAVAIKGFDGAIETILGLIVAIAGPWPLYTFAIWSVAPDLAMRFGDGAAHAVEHSAVALTHAPVFAVVYLLVHGPLKLALAACLLLGKAWIFPLASLVLLGFVVYLAARAIDQTSLWLGVFALFDAATLALVLNEWRVRRWR